MESNEFDLDSTSPSKSKFEEIVIRYKYVLILILVGLVLILVGIFYSKIDLQLESSKVEIIGNDDEGLNPTTDIIVEIAGAVNKPGVYKLKEGSRVVELVSMGGELKADADLEWFEKTVNKAAKLTDGQKLYIPKLNEQSDVLSANTASDTTEGSGGDNAEKYGLVNINTASLSELDKLPGIGPVYGQNIIDHRPYSSVEELLSKDVLKKNVYEKIKDKISVF